VAEDRQQPAGDRLGAAAAVQGCMQAGQDAVPAGVVALALDRLRQLGVDQAGKLLGVVGLGFADPGVEALLLRSISVPRKLRRGGRRR
jgi:hypothetical protein